MSVRYCIHHSPLGDLLLVAAGDCLTDLHLLHGKYVPALDSDWLCAPGDALLRETMQQLDAYFERCLRRFSIPLAPRGTEFQRRAWTALCSIPYGETRSYGAQAKAMQHPSAVRAVGAANGRNPISIIIPCHRVVGADGSLTGYAGGLAAKAYLLQLEGIMLGNIEANVQQRLVF